jgi:hypothetical protein
MNVKELIQELKKLPQDLPIRTDNRYPEGENEWIVDIECSRTGESGYEIEGEVRLLTSLEYMSITQQEKENLLKNIKTINPKII